VSGRWLAAYDESASTGFGKEEGEGEMAGSRVLFICAVLATAATTATVAPASGAPQPSLAGEVMLAGANSGAPGSTAFAVTLWCGGTAPSHWTYSASGVASGPYPGTFTENGTVYVDATGLGEPGTVLSIHADFTIASGTTIVTGSKDLKVVATNTGSCSAGASSYDAKFVTAATYSATIDTASGSFTDAGSASYDTERSESFDISQTPSVSLGGISRFRSSFDTSSGVVSTSPSKGTMVGAGLTNSGVVFGVFAKSNSSGLIGMCGAFDFVRHTLIRCLTVDSFVISGSSATMTGDAMVNSTKTRYRIDVTDLGDVGHRDTFKIQTDSGYTTQGNVVVGGIRIHA
jgi:hypothetical protein